MKIAISTLNGYENHGNRLQNYALQKILEDQGHQVVTIINSTKSSKSWLNRRFEELKTGQLIYKASQKINKTLFKDQDNEEIQRIRHQNIYKFSKKYIRESDFVINEKTKNFSFDDSFDCYVVGSDQVWNPNFSRFSKLDFIHYSKKPRISYAASFGVENIDSSYKSLFKEGLETFQCISVREDSGKKLVEKLTEKKAEVVLDPTLLLDRYQWQQLIEHKPVYLEKYVFLYFLDELKDEDRKYIENYAKEKNCIIKDLSDQKNYNLWVEDPAGFLNLISQSEAVFTDSFHGTVFSIIFERYFEVFKRNFNGPSMDSRIDTLLNDLKLTNRWHMKNELVNQSYDYLQVNDLLKKRKEESMKFIKKALHEVESLLD